MASASGENPGDTIKQAQQEILRHHRAGGLTYDHYCGRCGTRFPCPDYLKAQTKLAEVLAATQSPAMQVPTTAIVVLLNCRLPATGRAGKSNRSNSDGRTEV